jgi:hypothetical protein
MNKETNKKVSMEARSTQKSKRGKQKYWLCVDKIFWSSYVEILPERILASPNLRDVHDR